MIIVKLYIDSDSYSERQTIAKHLKSEVKSRILCLEFLNVKVLGRKSQKSPSNWIIDYLYHTDADRYKRLKSNLNCADIVLKPIHMETIEWMNPREGNTRELRLKI